MRNLGHIFFFLCMVILSLAAQADSASILAQAQASNAARYQFALSNNAEIRNTSDNKAFTLWWQPSATTPPSGVIVTLHGHDSFATDEFYLWQPYAQSRGYAILALQWWFGVGEALTDYYQPQEMYPIIRSLLTEKGIQPGAVLFHGYSRGSANSYGVTALDVASGNPFFTMTLSNSGGAATDFPFNKQIDAGAYGAKPFNGIQWVMYCGEKDPDPSINGCPAMNAAKDWVTQYGATVKLLIDDPNGNHGGFMTNSSNVNTALAQFSPTLRIKLLSGWNLLGNSFTSSLDVAPTLADTSNISTVWKWTPATNRWAFYTPSLATSELATYASGNGYDVLSTISGGEGFWVNAKQAFTLQMPAGSAILATDFKSSGTKKMVQGWNLITMGETKTPKQFNTALGSDVTTLWVWDASKSKWYFYAPSLDASGGLTSYIDSSGYLDFTASGISLSPGLGFWVNAPAALADTAP